VTVDARKGPMEDRHDFPGSATAPHHAGHERHREASVV
jgi:hypothetical protein